MPRQRAREGIDRVVCQTGRSIRETVVVSGWPTPLIAGSELATRPATFAEMVHKCYNRSQCSREHARRPVPGRWWQSIHLIVHGSVPITVRRHLWIVLRWPSLSAHRVGGGVWLPLPRLFGGSSAYARKLGNLVARCLSDEPAPLACGCGSRWQTARRSDRRWRARTAARAATTL